MYFTRIILVHFHNNIMEVGTITSIITDKQSEIYRDWKWKRGYQGLERGNGELSFHGDKALVLQNEKSSGYGLQKARV